MNLENRESMMFLNVKLSCLGGWLFDSVYIFYGSGGSYDELWIMMIELVGVEIFLC